MIKTLLLTLAALLALLLIFAATRPDSFRVQRSLRVAASAEKIYPLIADLRAFDRWNPFARKDPQIKLEYSGAASGVGAKSSFDGNRDVGRGSVEVVGVDPPSSVTMKLTMLSPFEIQNQVRFTLRPAADAAATEVTWAMEGPVPYLAKIAHLVFDMDKMVGGEFEAGLANLKAAVEQPR